MVGLLTILPFIYLPEMLHRVYDGTHLATPSPAPGTVIYKECWFGLIGKTCLIPLL